MGYIHSLESFGSVDGPGVRFVVFFQGCPMRCAYCHNPDTWEMNAGELMEPSYLIEQYNRNKDFYKNGGITVTGGSEWNLKSDGTIREADLTLRKSNGSTVGAHVVLVKANAKAKYDRLQKMSELYRNI